MSLKNFLSPVIPSFPSVLPDTEIEVLQELPVETLYLALKSADAETTLWFLENALPSQVQGLVDIDCWKGSEFIPSRSTLFFRELALLSPEKLSEYMKNMDPEIIVRTMLEHVQVVDYEPNEPLDLPEKSFLLSPDNKYVLILKSESPQIRESLYQWLNKMSSMGLDHMRRVLESCKWEQVSDLEEFGYQIKKGRLEDMGFVDYHEAIRLYAHGSARSLREEMKNTPISKSTKTRVRSIEEADEEGEALSPEQWWPEVISGPLYADGFLAKALESIEDRATRDVLQQEILRTLNAAMAADDVLHKDLKEIEKVLTRGRLYLDLGLSYLAEGSAEKGANWLETQPLMEVYRLGWLVVQDLQTAAKSLLSKTPVSFFGSPDSEIIQGIAGRHPQLEALLLQDMGLEEGSWLKLDGIVKVGERMAQLAWVQKFFLEDLKALMNLEEKPLLPGESAYSRLATALFRQNTAGEESKEVTIQSAPLSQDEWKERAARFNKDSFSKALNLVVEQAPDAAKALIQLRFDSLVDDLDYFSSKAETEALDPRFFKALTLDESFSKKVDS